MTKEIDEVPGSLEAEQILITTQKIVPVGCPLKGQCGFENLLFQVSVERRGSAEITKEYSPLKPKCEMASMLEEGSKISGDKMWGFSGVPFKQPKKGGRGKTAKHSGQEATLKKCCFLTLIHGYRGEAISVHPKGSLPKLSISAE